MVDNPTISIVIPFNENVTLLKDLVCSICRQTFSDFEIIIVNDGMINDSVLKDCFEKSVPVTLVNSGNSGVSVARNKGIKKSRGKFVTFADADDLVRPNWLSGLLSPFKENNVDISVCGYRYFYDTPSDVYQVVEKNSRQLLSKNQIYYEWILGVDFDSFVWNKMFRRSLLVGSEFESNVAYLEDQIFIDSLLERIRGIEIVSGSEYLYRQRRDSAVHRELSLNDIGSANRAAVLLEKISKSAFTTNEFKELSYRKILIIFGLLGRDFGKIPANKINKLDYVTKNEVHSFFYSRKLKPEFNTKRIDTLLFLLVSIGLRPRMVAKLRASLIKIKHINKGK